MVLKLSLLDIVFWLLSLLIAVLAYCMEPGLCTRRRTMISSSILSATVAKLVMMSLIEDNSSFGTSEPAAQEEKKKNVGGGGSAAIGRHVLTLRLRGSALPSGDRPTRAG
jgi:hypothetical protein